MKNFEAVQHIYPNAVFSMVDDDINKITWVGEQFPVPSAEQVAEVVNQLETARNQEIVDREYNKASALAKLAAIGLTADEALALFN
jgi:hypothetical protein